LRIINNVLFYTDGDIKRIPKDKTFENVIPKGKYHDVRKFEDSIHEKRYYVITNGQKQEVRQKFLTQEGLVNREEGRAKNNSLKMKGHKLDYHQKQVKKRREMNKKRRNNIYA
jgi:hypothetical protein